jgi:hypothetical protein
LNVTGKRGAGYAACIAETRHGSGLSVGIPERRDRVEGLGKGGRGILKWISKKWVGGCVLGLCGSG